MTEILFYTFADNPLDVARRVAAKAHGQGRQVMIYAPDAAVADAIDRLLWTTPALGFVPHCRDSDALTYAERFEPDAVVYLATLTGACVSALGAHPSALFSNHDPLAREIEHAADHAWDRVWRMPLWDD